MSHRRAQLLFCLTLLVVSRQAAATGGCSRFDMGVDLVLSSTQQTARSASSVTCLASNGVENWEGTFSGNVRVHQVSPAIDYESPISGSGTSYDSVTAPANYQTKTCYQGFVSATSGYTSGSAQSSELCTPDPPPPPPPCNYCACDGSLCEQSPTCPIVLDLNGDGLHTTSIADPVRFWTDFDGEIESTSWTNPDTEDAFLWIDLDHDYVAQVNELFGSRMLDASGDIYPNGYQALTQYDLPENGGDGDGAITQRDRVWARLKLWVDRNHDGVSQPAEISVPSSHGIVSLDLNRVRRYDVDPNGNEIYLLGRYFVRQGNETVPRVMADIEFQFAPYD